MLAIAVAQVILSPMFPTYSPVIFCGDCEFVSHLSVVMDMSEAM